jgi:hypothetical protein
MGAGAGGHAFVEVLRQGQASLEAVVALLDDAAFEASSLNADLEAMGASAERAAKLRGVIKSAVADWLISGGLDERETAREKPTDGEVLKQIGAVAKAARGMEAALRSLSRDADIELQVLLASPMQDLMGNPIPEYAINRTAERQSVPAVGLIPLATGRRELDASPDLSAVLSRVREDLASLAPELERLAVRPVKKGRQDILHCRAHLWAQVIHAWHDAAGKWPTATKTQNHPYKATSPLPNVVRALVRGATGSEPHILTDDSFLSALENCKAGRGILGAVRRDAKRSRRRRAPTTAAKPKQGKRKPGN